MKNKFYTSKKMYLVFTFLFLWLSFASMKAQTIELVSNVGINYPNAVALNGDQLYFCEITLGGGGDLGVIDINETFPALVTTVLSDLGSLAGLLVIGDELYITINSQNKVVKIDLTSPNPTPVDVTTTINSAYGLIQNGNDLYISTDDGNNGIYKIDLAGPIPQMPVQVLAGFNTAGMVIKGDELYYSSYSGTSISKINLSLSNPTPELVIDGLSGPDGMVLNGNFLYVSEFHGDRISRIDLGQSNLVAETFVSGVSGPSLGVFDGVNFYFAEHDSDEISRVVIIDPLLSSFSPVCFNAMPDNLGGASPAGGTYSGENITDNGDGETFTFDAASAGVGMHTVTYTISGQTVTSTIEVVIPVEINVVGQEHVTCNGAANGSIFTTTLNGTGAFSYIWSNGSTSAQLSAVSGGTYSVTVSDANGCTSTASGTITEPTALEVSMTVDANTCAGLETGAATASATGGTLPYTYGWFGGTASVTGLGVGAYDITVFDDNNCQITSSVSIIEFPPTVVTFDSSGPFDIGAGIQSALGGGSPTGGDPQISGLFDNTDYDADGDPSDGYECWAEPGGASLENTIWYTFTGDGNTYRLRTIECSATNYNNDTQVAIYSGDCTNPTPIVCNDDEDLDGGIYNIKVEFSTEVGVTYLVMIDGYSGSDGEFCLEVTNLGEAVAFLALDAICVDAGTTSYGGATPEGGTYSGPGVSDDGNGMTFSFDPAAAGAGSHNITYTSNSGLTGTSTIEVFSLPTVSFTTSGTIDINDGVQTGLGGGTPTGGVYSGSGVTDDGNGMSYSFDPVAAGVGDHSITYSFTDANGCNNAAMDDVTVSDMVDVDNLLDRLVYVYPNPTSGLVYFKGMVPEEVKVVDALGRLLSSQTLLRNELDLSGLPSGVYTLLVTFEDMEQRKLRVVKE